MLTFKILRFRNFLSYGNLFQEIDLSGNPLTIISGKNGSGKSTVITALSFALFNKTNRDINKAQLVNSITRKDCLVEVEFSAGPHFYKVVRGQKPSRFEIYKDGTLVDQTAATRDYQTILEKEILKLDYKTFFQVVVLAAGRKYVPFMELPAAMRRQVVEELLDLEVFTKMNEGLKVLINDSRTKQDQEERQYSALKEQIAWIKQNSDRADDIQQKMDELQKKLETHKAKMGDYDQGPLDQAVTVDMQVAHRIANVKKDIGFYEHNDVCGTCRQEIQPTFKASMLDVLRQRLCTLIDGQQRLAVKLSHLRNAHDTHNKAKSELTEMKCDLVILDGKKQLATKADTAIHEVEEKVKASALNLMQISEDRDLLLMAQKLLKDDGIKSKIILRYIPLFNTIINRYLSDMDFLCSFELNENFEETIRSRFRDEFCYGNFSQGEKLRIDLAILFTWREIARMRNSLNTNLLIFDEILDSSLDALGEETLIEILRRREKINVFIITHKQRTIDQAANILTAVKQKGFSRIDC